MGNKQQKFSKIKKFLIENADAIQKLATQHHKEYLGGEEYRSEIIDKYQKNHIKVVKEFAKNLETKNLKRGTKVFKKLGDTLAKDAVRDGLTIEEAVNGTIFLKQAIWQMLDKEGILNDLTAREFYQISQSIGTYSDVTASKIAFEFHTNYVHLISLEAKERKHAEQILIDERKFAEDIVETIREPLLVLDENLRVVSVNQSFYSTFKVGEKETTGELIYELGNNQWDIPELRKLLNEILPQEKVFNDYEVSHNFPAIGHKIMLLNARKIDHVKLILLAIEDITARRVGEKNFQFLAEASRLLASSLDFQTTLNNVAKLAVPEIADWCAIDLLDSKGELAQVAVAHKDPKKVKWAKELRKADPPDLNDPTGIPNVIRTGKSEFYPEITDELLVKVAKSKKQLKLMRDLGFTSAMVVPLCKEGKCIGGITFVTTETKKRYTKTDLIMAEELANRASIALENAGLYKASQEAVELRDNFISVASHELKTPVTSVKMFTQVLKHHSEQIGDQKAVEQLSTMDKQLNKLTELIYNLLNVSKIQAGRMEFKQELFDFDKSVKEVIDVLQQTSPKHKIEVQGETRKKIVGDEERIGQVVNNLVANAIKYSPKAKKVIICLESDKESVKVAVKDFGIGMHTEHLGKIFERFYRVYDTTDKTFPGLGIGLYISQEIVKRHGGKLWVESDIGKGSTFYFTLPVNGNGKIPGRKGK